MSNGNKVKQGSAAWFEMAGGVMLEAALEAGLPGDLTVSFLERYTDGLDLGGGLMQGLRFNIAQGVPSFEVGVPPNSRADIMVEVSREAACKLNTLWSGDPMYEATRKEYLRTGEMRVVGEISRLGDWLDSTHDPIVERTE